MKALKIFSTIVAVIGIIFYLYDTFGNANGKVYDFDSKHHVYYKGDGVTKDDAKNVGKYFKSIGYFKDGSAIDVQISAEKNKDNLKIAYIVSGDSITSEDDKAFLLVSSALADSAFKSRKMAVTLADIHLEEIKNLGYTSSQAGVPAQNQNDSTSVK